MDRLGVEACSCERRRNEHARDSPAGDRFAFEHEERIGEKEHRERRQTSNAKRDAEHASQVASQIGAWLLVEVDQDVRLRRQGHRRDCDAKDDPFENRKAAVIRLVQQMGPQQVRKLDEAPHRARHRVDDDVSSERFLLCGCAVQRKSG